MATLLEGSSTLAVIFGAHDWHKSGLGNAPSFLRSAQQCHKYLIARRPLGLGLDPHLVFDLFDDKSPATTQLIQIRDSIKSRVAESRGKFIRDVLIYYIGHGSCVSGKHLHLLVRDSREGIEEQTAIAAPALAQILRVSAPQQRRLLILDCCFSEAAAEAFGAMGALDEAVAATAIRDMETAPASPDRGTLLLCSSPRRRPAIGVPDAAATLFTGALLNVLTKGSPGRTSEMLSFADLRDDVYDKMLKAYGQEPPRPALHQPDQQYGDLTHLPAFPNVAHSGVRRTPTEQDDSTSRVPLVPAATPQKLLLRFRSLFILVVTIAIVGAGLAYYQTRNKAVHAADSKIQDAVNDLSSPTANKLFALSVLRSALSTNPEHAPEILTGVASALSVERDISMRNSLATMFDNTSAEHLNPAALAAVLEDLASLSRSLVEKANLHANHQWLYERIYDDSAEARAQSLATAIVALLHAGVRTTDLSGIYCGQCTLSGLDLHSINLSGAILGDADLSRTNLADAKLDGADLERTNLQFADLRSASIRGYVDPRQIYMQDYAFNRLQAKLGSFSGPSFKCANLDAADFTGQAVFFFVAPQVGVGQINFGQADFAGASMTRTRLNDSVLLLVAPKDEKHFPFQLIPNTWGPGGAGRANPNVRWGGETRSYNVYFFNLGNEPRPVTVPDSDAVYQDGLNSLKLAFSGSKLQDASLPPWLRGWLDRNTASSPVDCTTR